MTRRSILSLILITGIACQGTKPPPTVEAPIVPQFTQAELDQANTYFMQGVVAFELQDYEEALDLLMMAYLRLPEHGGVNFALADAYLANADPVSASFYAREAIKAEPKNRFYHMKLAEIHLRGGHHSASIEALTNALAAFPNDLEFMYLLASTYTDQGDFRRSNQLYDRILKQDPTELSVYYQKFRNHTGLNEPDSAAVQMEMIRKRDPSNLLAAQTLAQLYLTMKQPEKAKGVYQDVLSRYPEKIELKIGLTDIHLTLKEWEDAGTLMSSVMESPTVGIETKIELMRYLLGKMDEDVGNESMKAMVTRLMEQFSATESTNATAQALAADYYSLIEDNENALIKIEATLALEPENANAWRQRMQLLYMAERQDELISLAQDAETYAPEDAFIRFFVGMAYFLKQDHANASLWLTRASEVPSRPPFKSIVLGSLGDVTYQLDDWDNAKRHYEAALKQNPENDTVLNNYAYYMSLKGEELEKAKKMSELALRISPKNPSFLDTLGWIYYLMGDYENALYYISSSLENGSQSAEVLEHKGDVLSKLGRYKEAIEFWNKSLETDPKRQYLLERIEEVTP